MRLTAEWESYVEMYNFCLQIVGAGPTATKQIIEKNVSKSDMDTGKLKELPAAQSEKVAEAKPAEGKAPEKKDEDPRLTKIKEIGVGMADTRMDGVNALLKAFGVGKFSKIPADKLDDFLEKITKMKDADDTKYGKMLAALSK